jgi:hypothetical protein
VAAYTLYQRLGFTVEREFVGQFNGHACPVAKLRYEKAPESALDADVPRARAAPPRRADCKFVTQVPSVFIAKKSNVVQLNGGHD